MRKFVPFCVLKIVLHPTCITHGRDRTRPIRIIKYITCIFAYASDACIRIIEYVDYISKYVDYAHKSEVQW